MKIDFSGNFINCPQNTFLEMIMKIALFLEDETELDLLTVHNVNEWLSSLHLVPTSSNTVDVDISEEGFKEFDRYKVEYTTIDKPDQWQQV